MDRGAAGEVLPVSQDDIDIGRADLDTDAGAAGHFGRDQARARTEKRVIDQLAGPAVVDDRTPHALDRLLRAVSPALLALSIAERIGDLPHGGLLAVTEKAFPRRSQFDPAPPLVAAENINRAAIDGGGPLSTWAGSGRGVRSARKRPS